MGPSGPRQQANLYTILALLSLLVAVNPADNPATSWRIMPRDGARKNYSGPEHQLRWEDVTQQLLNRCDSIWITILESIGQLQSISPSPEGGAVVTSSLDGQEDCLAFESRQQEAILKTVLRERQSLEGFIKLPIDDHAVLIFMRYGLSICKHEWTSRHGNGLTFLEEATIGLPGGL